MVRPAPPPEETPAALAANTAARLAAALPEADEAARRTHQAVLLDSLVHELDLLRGALGEPDRIKYAAVSRRNVTCVLEFGGVECVLAWADLPGIARYHQELAFYAP